MNEFLKNDFLKSGISDNVTQSYIGAGYLIDEADGWRLYYPEFLENTKSHYYNQRLKKPKEGQSKYIKPAGESSRLFRPLALSPQVISDPSEYLIITEGEKKAIKAVQEGFNCVSLGGVWAWKTRPKDDEDASEDEALCADIIPGIKNADFKDKDICLCCDNDMWQNPQVKRALYQLAAYLTSEKGAIIKIIELPKGEAKGLDDFLVQCGAGEFQKLIDNAKTLTLKGIQDILSDKVVSKADFPIDYLLLLHGREGRM